MFFWLLYLHLILALEYDLIFLTFFYYLPNRSIKAILPERMKIKLLAIDTLPPLDAPAPLEYFITQGRLEKWKYAPPGCVKVGAETIFA